MKLPQVSQKVILIFAAIIFLSIISIVPSSYFYFKFKDIEKKLAEKQSLTEVQILKEKVGMLIDLPEDEEPVIITITDAGALQSQPFFAKAKNGDKVLVYNQAKKAILFDPSRGKLVEVGPIITPSATPTESPQITPGITKHPVRDNTITLTISPSPSSSNTSE